jgi:hypothetical protein
MLYYKGTVRKHIEFTSQKVECPICTEQQIGVKWPNCDHSTCVSCFSRCQWGEPFIEPPFPYNDPCIKEAYDNYDKDEDGPGLFNKFPLLMEYDKIYNKMLSEHDMKNVPDNLKKCPICRK